MFCSKCGAKNDAGTRFCPSCGASMGGQHPAQAHTPATRQASQAYRYPTSPPGGHRQSSPVISYKKIGMIASAVVLIIVIIVIIITTSGSSNDRALLGTWVDTTGSVRIKFNQNEKGELAWGSDTYNQEFTWETDKDGRIWMQLGDVDFILRGRYETAGDRLWLTLETWGETLELRKVK